MTAMSIETLPELTVATLRHIGPYPRIGEAFGRLAGIAKEARLFALPGAKLCGIYHDDPQTMPAESLRSDAGIVVPTGTVVPAGLTEVKLPPGVYAKAVHHGAYSGLPAAWAGLKKWIAANDHRIVPRASFELYPNDPDDTAEADLITELYFPVS